MNACLFENIKILMEYLIVVKITHSRSEVSLTPKDEYCPSESPAPLKSKQQTQKPYLNVKIQILFELFSTL